ncbi:hypothetical protein OIDMADRAFT_157923 [Oidiodendron maius Zn]|uniref:Xylanolytic transcriptional activator regulatory domain-containing protein n=1 Tax=Oidiodendron maius (strain Zn) TaxID=913774 RepID=A0A0C3HSN8_OIDMZ|nr:hypothetical protein OIDMADRAFT_157923 [Oidiodendron maius Zn]
MNHNDNHQAATIKFNAPLCGLQISEESTKLYVTAYFDHIHPIYPFLDRQTFERKVFQGDLALLLQDSPPFSALYYSVLALGSQYHGSGSFEPGRGTSWKFFQAALGLFPEILIPKETLVNVQAIFARNSSCVQIGDMLTAEAARMAQSLGLNRAICDSENISVSQRTFWVIYILEKTLSFACGRSSILIDSDIGTPVPEAPEANFGKFDWFYSVCRFSRLISKAYDALFSISATLLSTNSIKSTIDNSNHELECWRKAIPEDFRPGSPLRHLCDLDKASIAITLRVHCHYYSVVIALTRLRLSLPEAASSCPATDDKEVLLNACRAIIELTKYIDLATYTPIWILVSVPISATFILFDFIIHDPTHDKTKSNLSLLGIAAGYFCSLEYVSGGALQTSLLSDIAHIARDYIHSVDRSDVVRRTDSIFEVGSSQHTDATRTELQTPVSIDTGGQNLMGGMFTGHMNMDEPFYPADTLLSPLGNRLPEGIDLMDLFSTALPDGIYSFE